MRTESNKCVCVCTAPFTHWFAATVDRKKCSQILFMLEKFTSSIAVF